MNTEQETNSADELSKENVAIVLGGLLDKLFSATLVAPALSQVGLTIGDQVKFFRIRNLMKLNESLERVIEKRNLDRSNLNKLSLSVGFPLLEKASYQSDGPEPDSMDMRRRSGMWLPNEGFDANSMRTPKVSQRPSET